MPTPTTTATAYRTSSSPTSIRRTSSSCRRIPKPVAEPRALDVVEALGNRDEDFEHACVGVVLEQCDFLFGTQEPGVEQHVVDRRISHFDLDFELWIATTVGIVEVANEIN